MTVYSIGQNLNRFLTDLGNHAPHWVSLYAVIGFVILLGSGVCLIRKQIKSRVVLYGFAILTACMFVNPLWFLPYNEFYQTALLLLMVPLVLLELCWRKLFTVADLALFNVPLWHCSVVYWIGSLNAA